MLFSRNICIWMKSGPSLSNKWDRVIMLHLKRWMPYIFGFTTNVKEQKMLVKKLKRAKCLRSKLETDLKFEPLEKQAFGSK